MKLWCISSASEDHKHSVVVQKDSLKNAVMQYCETFPEARNMTTIDGSIVKDRRRSELHIKKRIAIIACSILSIMFLAWGVTIAQLGKNGPCISDYPLGEPGRGLMHSETFYELGYPGTHEYSSKACWEFVRVTKEEYGRHMYKE